MSKDIGRVFIPKWSLSKLLLFRVVGMFFLSNWKTNSNRRWWPSLYPVFGTRLASKTTLKPWANWLSAVISHFNKLSVFHFSRKVKPYSGTTYFVSRLPEVRAVSVLCSPITLKFTPLAVRVFTSSLKTLKTRRSERNNSIDAGHPDDAYRILCWKYRKLVC